MVNLRNQENEPGWRRFFAAPNASANDDHPSALSAFSKLSSFAYQQYAYHRELLPSDCFSKNNFQGFKFFILNSDNEKAKAGRNAVQHVAKFIQQEILQSFRSLCLVPEGEDMMIIEELRFGYCYYGRPSFSIEMGNNEKVVVDFDGANFSSFLDQFFELDKSIKEFCGKLSPLPRCVKRLRTTFYKNADDESAYGPFNPAEPSPVYSPDISSFILGRVALNSVGMAIMLRSTLPREQESSDEAVQDVSIFEESRSVVEQVSPQTIFTPTASPARSSNVSQASKSPPSQQTRKSPRQQEQRQVQVVNFVSPSQSSKATSQLSISPPPEQMQTSIHVIDEETVTPIVTSPSHESNSSNSPIPEVPDSHPIEHQSDETLVDSLKRAYEKKRTLVEQESSDEDLIIKKKKMQTVEDENFTKVIQRRPLRPRRRI